MPFTHLLHPEIPKIKEVNINEVADHVEECPRCKDRLSVNLDGKPGAMRRVCANQEGFHFVPELGVAVQSGCLNMAPSLNLHCGLPSLVHTIHDCKAAPILWLQSGTHFISLLKNDVSRNVRAWCGNHSLA